MRFPTVQSVAVLLAQVCVCAQVGEVRGEEPIRRLPSAQQNVSGFHPPQLADIDRSVQLPRLLQEQQQQLSEQAARIEQLERALYSHEAAPAGGANLSSSKLTTRSLAVCKWFPVRCFCLGILSAAEQVFGGMLEHEGQSRQP